MSLKDIIPKEHTLTVQGQDVVITPIDWNTYVALQDWIDAESPNKPDRKPTLREQGDFGMRYAARCVMLACPAEDLTDEEAMCVIMADGAREGKSELVNHAMLACWRTMPKETAAALPS